MPCGALLPAPHTPGRLVPCTVMMVEAASELSTVMEVPPAPPSVVRSAGGRSASATARTLSPDRCTLGTPRWLLRVCALLLRKQLDSRNGASGSPARAAVAACAIASTAESARADQVGGRQAGRRPREERDRS